MTGHMAAHMTLGCWNRPSVAGLPVVLGSLQNTDCRPLLVHERVLVGRQLRFLWRVQVAAGPGGLTVKNGALRVSRQFDFLAPVMIFHYEQLLLCSWPSRFLLDLSYKLKQSH